MQKTTQEKRVSPLQAGLFVVLFSLLALLGRSINFSALVGAENQFFTLFQFFGPVAGGFLGPALGALAVLGAEAAHFVLTGKALEPLNLLRLAPMVVAAYYFGAYRAALSDPRSWVGVVVPVLAIAAFVAHPVGGQVWFFALFWTIPLLVRFLPDWLVAGTFFRSLGATFTAHAVGGALWVWTVPMPAEAWVALIPVVLYERTLFALGITGSYLAFNAVLARVAARVPSITRVVRIDPRYQPG